jgi:hypothetical protein
MLDRINSTRTKCIQPGIHYRIEYIQLKLMGAEFYLGWNSTFVLNVQVEFHTPPAHVLFEVTPLYG